MKTLRLCITGFIVFLAFSCSILAQTIGDYRTKASGDWSSPLVWEKYQMIITPQWGVALTAPTSSDGAITIQGTHSVAVTADVTADQMVVEAGGYLAIAPSITLTLDAGSGTDLTVNGTLAIADGSLSGAGTVDYGANGTLVYNGTTQTTTDAEFPSSSGPANLTVGDGATVSLHAPRTINGILSIVDNGTFADNGNQIGAGGASTLMVSLACTLKLGATLAPTTFPAFTTIDLDIESMVEYVADGAAQTVSTAPDYGYLRFTGAGSRIVEGGTLTIRDNWYVGSPTDLSVNNPTVNANADVASGFSSSISMGSGDINVAGNWTAPDGTAGGSGAVVFTGNSPTIVGTAFHNVTFNNSVGAVLTGSIVVNGILTLTNGIITLSGGYLFLNPGASVIGGSATSFVDGIMYHQVASASPTVLTFPIGDGSSYRPVTVNITMNDAVTATFNAQVFNGTPPSNSLPPTLDRVSDVRYWQVQVGGGNGWSSATLQLFYGSDDGVSDPTNLRVAFNNGFPGSWEDFGGTGTANTTGSITVNIPNTFQFFVLANATGGTNPLPVQLTSFAATANRLNAELKWKTETEVENYGFEVERRIVASSELTVASSNQQETGNRELGTSWSSVGFVQGFGTSSSPHEYSFSDKHLSAGRYAYRIKQIDQSGSFTYTSALEVEVGLAPLEFTLSQNYPNPFNPTTTIEFTLPEDGHVILRIYDMTGREVSTLVNEERKAGVYQQVVFDASRIASGLYFARLQTGGKQLMKKLVFVK